MRAISTVLDVSLFLLLVGAAIGTLSLSTVSPATGTDAASDPADDVAERLATSTTRVNYSVGQPLAALAEGKTADPAASIHDRSDHGTYAELLAAAAIANAELDGHRLTVGGHPFAAAVARTTQPVLRRPGGGTSVRAVWTPTTGSELRGRVHVGEEPPPDADVRTATIVLDSGLPAARHRAIATAERDGMAGVAAVLAETTVEGFLPREQTRTALRAEYPANRLAAIRYRLACEALDMQEPSDLDGLGPGPRQRIRAALFERYERSLRERYAEPTAAARSVRSGRVTVLVRTWSR